MRAGLLVAVAVAVGGACASGCAAPAPYVRYDGADFGRKPKPADDMEVLRTGPPATRYRDLGTVVVTCPSEAQAMPGFGFWATTNVGGCDYHWAVRKACERAATVGADGIHSVESTTNGSGQVVSLKASVFVRLPKLVTTPPPPPKRPPEPTVEERLKQLEQLKTENLITPEEYAKKRTEILDDI